MSVQVTGLTFSANADKSANDYTLHLRPACVGNTWVLGAEYKNSEPNPVYQLEVDLDDLETLGRLLVAFAQAQRPAEGSASRDAFPSPEDETMTRMRNYALQQALQQASHFSAADRIRHWLTSEPTRDGFLDFDEFLACEARQLEDTARIIRLAIVGEDKQGPLVSTEDGRLCERCSSPINNMDPYWDSTAGLLCTACCKTNPTRRDP